MVSMKKDYKPKAKNIEKLKVFFAKIKEENNGK